MVFESGGEDGIGWECDVDWSSRNKFKLFLIEEGKSYVLYSGVISGEIMSLNKINPSSLQVLDSYELKKIY
jgi:hypothetical protein